MNATIDVSRLPSSALDHRSPIWWGNLLLLLIETSMFAILVATYSYMRMDFQVWPPPKTNETPTLLQPFPSLGIPTLNLGVLLLSVIPAALLDRACLGRRQGLIRIALALCILLGIVATGLRFFEFGALRFSWDANGYASVVWGILGMHLMHLVTITSELVILATWSYSHEMDEKHSRDLRVTAAYWYWVVGIWVPLYLLVYGGPRTVNAYA